MSTPLTNILMQLLVQAPLFIVYAAAILFAILFWRRCSSPALLVLIGSLLLIFVTIAQTAITQYIFYAGVGAGISPSTTLTTIAVAAGIFRAIGIGLFIAAAFTGRNAPQGAFPISPLR